MDTTESCGRDLMLAGDGGRSGVFAGRGSIWTDAYNEHVEGEDAVGFRQD